MRAAIALSLVVPLIAGCASRPADQSLAAQEANAAYTAQIAGDWLTARSYYRSATAKAEVIGVRPEGLAVLWYEYGRASGVSCDWDEAERALSRAYALDRQSGGPTYMSLYELGRMNLERERFREAADLFERVRYELAATRIEMTDPQGYADFLDEYAIALERTDRAAEARDLLTHASELRWLYDGHQPKTRKTPYGRSCTTS